MSERFTVPLKYQLSHSKIQCDGTPLINDELVRILNTNDGAFLENFYLKKEKKNLQYKLRNCEDARQSYKEDWKACSSYCDEYKSEIISLKDEVEGLIEEKNELKEFKERLLFLIEEKQKFSKENIDKQIEYPHLTFMEYYYKGIFEVCVQLKKEAYGDEGNE